MEAIANVVPEDVPIEVRLRKRAVRTLAFQGRSRDGADSKCREGDPVFHVVLSRLARRLG